MDPRSATIEYWLGEHLWGGIAYRKRMAAETDPEEVVRDCFAWFNGDESNVSAMAETVDVYNPGLPDGSVHSRERWYAYVREIKKGFPDISFDIKAIASNDNVVMVEVKTTGTHKQTFQGLPATGNEVEVWSMVKLVVVDGQVHEYYEYYNRQEIPEQLGLTFPDILRQLPTLAMGKLRASI